MGQAAIFAELPGATNTIGSSEKVSVPIFRREDQYDARLRRDVSTVREDPFMNGVYHGHWVEALCSA
jgi:hypothetical protein